MDKMRLDLLNLVQVLKLNLNKGAQRVTQVFAGVESNIFGCSVAVPLGTTLVIGSVYDDGLEICQGMAV